MSGSRPNAFPRAFAAVPTAFLLVLPATLAAPAEATIPDDTLPQPTVWVEEDYGIPNDGGVGYGSEFTIHARGLVDEVDERLLEVVAGGWFKGLSLPVGHLAKKEADGTYSFTIPSSEIMAPNQEQGIFSFHLDRQVAVSIGVDKVQIVIPPESYALIRQVGNELPLRIVGVDPDARFVLASTLRSPSNSVVERTAGPILSGSELEATFPLSAVGDLWIDLYHVIGDESEYGGTVEERLAWLADRNNAGQEMRLSPFRIEKLPLAISYTFSDDDPGLITLTFRNLQKVGVSSGDDLVAVAANNHEFAAERTCLPDSFTFFDEADGSLSAKCTLRVPLDESMLVGLNRAPAGWRDMPLDEIVLFSRSEGKLQDPKNLETYSLSVNPAGVLRSRDPQRAEKSKWIPPRKRSEAYWAAERINDGYYNKVNGFMAVPWNVAGENIILGDWDGDGATSVGYRIGANTFRFAETVSDEGDVTWGDPVSFGREGDQIFVGDWDGDGVDTVGLRRGRMVYLSNARDGGRAEIEFSYGRLGDEVVVGDWDDDGRDTVGLRRGNNMYLTNGFRGGRAEIEFAYGRVGDDIFVGDWNADGVDSFAVRRGDTFYFTDLLEGGWAQKRKWTRFEKEPGVVGCPREGAADFIFLLYRSVRVLPVAG